MFRDFLISLSFANICLSNIWLRFFYRSKLYMKYFPTANSFLALIINEILFTLVIWGSLRLIGRFSNKIILRAVKILVCLMVLAFLSATANSLRAIVDKTIFNAVLLAVTVILLWRRTMFKATMVLIMLLAPLALIILGQSAQGIFSGCHENALPVVSRPIVNPNPNTPRVLWLIFDEMDQRIAFIDRPQNIKLPELIVLNDNRYSRKMLILPPGPPSHPSRRSFPVNLLARQSLWILIF